jgi:hypothetical protein
MLGTVGAKAQPDVLVFLTRDECAQTDKMREHLDAALRTLKRPTRYPVVDADTLPQNDARRGYGTPTVLVRGRDLFDMPDPGQGDHTPT